MLRSWTSCRMRPTNVNENPRPGRDRLKMIFDLSGPEWINDASSNINSTKVNKVLP